MNKPSPVRYHLCDLYPVFTPEWEVRGFENSVLGAGYSQQASWAPIGRSADRWDELAVSLMGPDMSQNVGEFL